MILFGLCVSREGGIYERGEREREREGGKSVLWLKSPSVPMIRILEYNVSLLGGAPR